MIEELGIIRRRSRRDEIIDLEVNAAAILTDLAPGDSVAADGVCLTVTAVRPPLFTAEISNNTAARTKLGQARVGDKVNLERAIKIGGRLGGHFVTGHVDCTATIHHLIRHPHSADFYLRLPSQFRNFIIPMGSIAIDGVSLTVQRINGNVFQVTVVAHTLNSTTLASKKNGDIVNLEFDLLEKMVVQTLRTEGEKADFDLLWKVGSLN